MGKTILLGHGSGGKLSHDLIKDLFVKYFSNNVLTAANRCCCRKYCHRTDCFYDRFLCR